MARCATRHAPSRSMTSTTASIAMYAVAGAVLAHGLQPAVHPHLVDGEQDVVRHFSDWSGVSAFPTGRRDRAVPSLGLTKRARRPAGTALGPSLPLGCTAKPSRVRCSIALAT